MPTFSKGYALVIGVADYRDQGLPVPNTPTGVPITVADALDVAKALKDPAVCAYPSDQVWVLTGHEATRAGVTAALRELARRTEPRDTVVVFFCGHGVAGEDGQYYLATQEAELTHHKIKADTGLSASELTTLLREILNAQKLLLLLNACFSGQVGTLGALVPAETLGTSIPGSLADALAIGEGRVIITASRASQRSCFIVGDDHTFFGRALIEGLHGKGVDSKNGYTGVYELYLYIHASVKAAAERVNAIQEPLITIKEAVGPFPVALFPGSVPGDLSTANFLQAPPSGAAIRVVEQTVTQQYGPGARVINIYVGRDVQSLNLPSEKEQGEPESAFEYLGTRPGWIREFTEATPPERKLNLEGPVRVEKLKDDLEEKGELKEPSLITVRGTFAPVLLLRRGWWEQRGKKKRLNLPWRDKLQEWLFYGFEEWGPSWDLAPQGKATLPYDFAQLAAGDEVNSLAILLSGDQIKTVREKFLDDRGWGVFEAEVTGHLFHRSHLKHAILSKVEKWGEFFDYALVVRDDAEEHGVARLGEEPDSYSGYLWQCFSPSNWLQETGTLHLNQVYFIWEHTDFTKPDAVRYNLDGLERKRAYLESKHGELVLLQKSCGVIPGEPAWPTEIFYNFIVPPGEGNS